MELGQNIENIQKEINKNIILTQRGKRSKTKDDCYSIEELVDEENLKTTPYFNRQTSRKFTTGPILERLSLFTRQLLNSSTDIQSESNIDNIITIKPNPNRRLSLVTESDKEIKININDNVKSSIERNLEKFKNLKIKIPDRNKVDLKQKYRPTSLDIQKNLKEKLSKELEIISDNKKNYIIADTDSEISINKYQSTAKELIIQPKISIESVESPKSPSKWKKISGLFRSVKSLNRYETKNIIDEDQIDGEIKDYHERLFDNTIKAKKTISDFDSSPKKSIAGSNFIKLFQLNESDNNEDSRILKDEVKKIIVNGQINSLKKIHRIYKKDPQYYLKEENNHKTMFDTPLPNGKNLFYIACQEGKVDIVKYMLDKKVDAFIKSKLDDKELESPLQVASRWNYIKVINLLLEKVPYKKEQINEVLEMKEITPKVKSILKNYIQVKFKKKKWYCC